MHKLKRIKQLFSYKDGKKIVINDETSHQIFVIRGDFSNLHGDASSIYGTVEPDDKGLGSLRGDVTGLSGNLSNKTGDISGCFGDFSRITGDMTGLKGDVTGLKNDVTNVSGDATGIKIDCSNITGDFDLLGLSEDERNSGVEIERYIEDLVTETKNPPIKESATPFIP